MSGLLAFAEGAAGEYLDQRKEDRTAKYQEIRDRRLSELRKDEANFDQGMVITENKRQELVKSKAAEAQREYNNDNYTYGYGDSVVRDGRVVHKGKSSSTNKPRGSLITLNNNTTSTQEEMRQLWEAQAYTTDKFSQKIRNPDIADWDEWYNARVKDEYKLYPQYEKKVDPDAPPSTGAEKQARQEAEEMDSYTSFDETIYGPGGKELWINRRAKEIDSGNSGVTGSGKQTSGVTNSGKSPEEIRKQVVALRGKPQEIWDLLKTDPKFESEKEAIKARMKKVYPGWVEPAEEPKSKMPFEERASKPNPDKKGSSVNLLSEAEASTNKPGASAEKNTTTVKTDTMTAEDRQLKSLKSRINKMRKNGEDKKNGRPTRKYLELIYAVKKIKDRVERERRSSLYEKDPAAYMRKETGLDRGYFTPKGDTNG